MTDYSKFLPDAAFQHLDPNAWNTETTVSFSSVRYRSKAWTLNHGGKNYAFKRADDGTPLSYLDVIILAINNYKSRIYFGDDEWTEDSSNAPICASLKGDVPDPGVSVPQAKACGICPNAEWVVRPDGRSKPSCQQHFRAAVLLIPSMTKNMLGAPLMEPVFFKIPPGSFKSWERYKSDMINTGIPLASVVTRIAFSPPPKTFEMTFEPVQKLTGAEAPKVLELVENPQTKVIAGSAPAIRQIEKKPAPASTRMDTGLMEAFGDNGGGTAGVDAPAPKQRKARAAKPVIIDNEVEPEPPRQTAATNGNGEETSAEPWEESSSDLDDTVAKLIGKTSNMLK